MPANGEIAQTPEGRITPLSIAPPEESLSEAMQLIKTAKRPVIVVGHGARFHMKEVLQLADLLCYGYLIRLLEQRSTAPAHIIPYREF